MSFGEFFLRYCECAGIFFGVAIALKIIRKAY